MHVLRQLERETLAQLRALRRGAQPKDYSAALFGRLSSMWQAWRNGIPPREGGYSRQNPRLLLAFETLDRALAQTQAEAAREGQRQAR